MAVRVPSLVGIVSSYGDNEMFSFPAMCEFLRFERERVDV